MVTLAFPELLIVMVVELEVPAFKFEKLRFAGFGDRVTDAAVPAPLRDKTLGELAALEVTLTVPAEVPAVVGANSTLKVALPPAGIVAGAASPLTL
jgi:hypothetical protein